MPKEFQRENRYVVFKRSDMRKYLSQSERRQVEGLALHICLSREDDGKQPLNCLVIEKDWPEYEPTWKSIEARVTGTQPAPSTKDAIIDDLQSQFDSDGITEHDSGDALIRLSDAIAAVEDNFAGAQPAPSFADAYQGAMEEVAIWKKRALEAEDLNRKFIAEINGPTYMGEQAQPAPIEPMDVIEQAVNRFLSWKLPKDFHPDGGMVFIPTKGRGYDSPHWPVGTNLLNAQQAREMLRYVLAAAPETKP